MSTMVGRWWVGEIRYTGPGAARSSLSAGRDGNVRRVPTHRTGQRRIRQEEVGQVLNYLMLGCDWNT